MKALYVRISKASQSIERQLKQESDLIYIDTCSGSVPFAERTEAKKLLNDKNVTLIQVKEVSRLGRNLLDILKTIEYFTEKGIDIYIENQGLHTLLSNGKINPTAQMIISILGTIAQQERDLLIERTKEGVAIAHALGKYKGRKRGAVAPIDKYKAKHIKDIELIKAKLKEGYSLNRIEKDLKISRQLIYRFIEKGLIEKPVS